MRFLLRLIGGLVTLVTSGLIIALGIALLFMHKQDVVRQTDDWWNQLKSYLPEGYAYRQILAVILVVLGVLALISLFVGAKKKRKKSISFAGAHGDVTIELENIEGVIEKVTARLPEVRDIRITLEPTDARSRVLVLAQAALMKDADVDARQVTDRVQDFIKQHTRKILGVQEVDVRLTVKKFLLNMRSVKPLPLLLEGPKETALVPVRATEGEAPQPS